MRWTVQGGGFGFLGQASVSLRQAIKEPSLDDEIFMGVLWGGHAVRRYTTRGVSASAAKVTPHATLAPMNTSQGKQRRIHPRPAGMVPLDLARLQPCHRQIDRASCDGHRAASYTAMGTVPDVQVPETEAQER